MIRAEDLVLDVASGGGRLTIIKGVSLSVPRGKLTILSGRSGSGKTTLLNMLGGLLVPTSGRVFYEENELYAQPTAKRERYRREKVGFVFQNSSLFPGLTAFENVEYGLRLAGAGPDEKQVLEWLETVGLQERIRLPIDDLSGGEQQRVAIARAFVHSPEIVFADEPTSQLDSDTSRRIYRLFRQVIAQKNVTALITSHDPEAYEAADLVIRLEDGRSVDEQEGG